MLILSCGICEAIIYDHLIRCQARYLSVTEAPHKTNFRTWMGKKHFVFLSNRRDREPNPVLTTTLGPPPLTAGIENVDRGFCCFPGDKHFCCFFMSHGWSVNQLVGVATSRQIVPRDRSHRVMPSQERSGVLCNALQCQNAVAACIESTQLLHFEFPLVSMGREPPAR